MSTYAAILVLLNHLEFIPSMLPPNVPWSPPLSSGNSETHIAILHYVMSSEDVGAWSPVLGS